MRNVFAGYTMSVVLKAFLLAERRGQNYHKWYQPLEETINSLEPSKTPRRWVVEQLFSWLNRWRRLLVRWEKLGETYQAFLQLACGLICFHYTSRLSVFG